MGQDSREDVESEAPRPQGGASGRSKHDYRVGFHPRLEGGHPADLPVTVEPDTRTFFARSDFFARFRVSDRIESD